MYIRGGVCFQERGLMDNTGHERVSGVAVFVLHREQITLIYWQHTFIGGESLFWFCHSVIFQKKKRQETDAGHKQARRKMLQKVDFTEIKPITKPQQVSSNKRVSKPGQNPRLKTADKLTRSRENEQRWGHETQRNAHQLEWLEKHRRWPGNTNMLT